MLPKKQRATTQQIKNAISDGITKNSKHFSIRVLNIELKTDHSANVAVVVSKKVAKLAVSRNKLKRRIRNILRKIDLQNNRTIVVYIKTGVSTLSVTEIQSELETLLKYKNFK